VAITNMRDTLAIGMHVGPSAYVCRVDNVNNPSGAIAINSVVGWHNFPDEKDWKWKPLYDKYEVKNKTGGFSVKYGKLIGGELVSTINQRDTASIEFYLKFMGFECLVLTQGHVFDRMDPAKRQWLAMFCTAEPLESEIGGENGEHQLKFSAITNKKAIVLGTDVAYPSDTSIVAPVDIPPSPITIPAGGFYKLIDIADS